jgi:uncharacterized protein (DUF2267 family)
MDEIIKMVASKTGLSEEMAKMAVEAVLSIVKTKLPPGIADQLEGFLDGKSDGSNPADLLGGLSDTLGGFFGNK